MVQSANTEFLLIKLMCVIVKIRFFIVLPLFQRYAKKNEYTILETFTKKNSLRNLTRFHDGLFESEILKIFTSVLSLKVIKESPQKRCNPPKNCLT